MGWSPRSSPEKASGTVELFPTRQRAGLRIFTSDFLYGCLAGAPHLRTSENGCLPGVRTSGSPASGPLSRLVSPVPFPSRLTPPQQRPSGKEPGDYRPREPTREEGAAAQGAARAVGSLPATQGLRRRGGARRGERRLLTGGACALGALIVPRSCRTARLPARRPFGASVGESPVVGAEPGAVPAASSSSPSPSSLPRTLRLCPPSRLRHPPAPLHSGRECPARDNLAAPRWLWSRFSGRPPPAPPPAPAPR